MYWRAVREKIDDPKQQSLSWVKPFLQNTFDWATRNDVPPKTALLPLIFKTKLDDDNNALSKAIALVQSIVKLPHFGNPKPEGYGHNGDMGAADQLLTLAFASHVLKNDLTWQQKKSIKKKFT